MNIEYKITDYFNENNLFDSDVNNGLLLKMDSKNLIIQGNSRDLVELADVLISISKSDGNNHVHLDDLTLINKDSSISEIIIDKVN